MFKAPAHYHCVGFYVLSTDKRGVLAEFPNLITDSGLNYMGANGGYLGYCQVGASNSTPVVSNTALGTYVAGTDVIAASVTGAAASAPYYTYRRNTYRFNQGAAAGTLAEVGVGWALAGSLFSRALIKDGNGNPTTITILSDEILDVTYELRIYAPTADITGSITLTGNIGGTYTWTLRPSLVTLSTHGAWYIPQHGYSMRYTETSYCRAYTGVLGDPTQTPAGIAMAIGEVSMDAYANNSLTASASFILGAGNANNAAGVRSLYLTLGPASYQLEFASPIMKTSLDMLSITLAHSWGRQP